MTPEDTACMRFTHAVTAAHEPGLDPVTRADRLTTVADTSAAHLIACGFNPNEITSLGLRMDRAGYENVRADWQRLLADNPEDEYYQRDGAAARATWLAIRPEWDDDWGIPANPSPALSGMDAYLAITPDQLTEIADLHDEWRSANERLLNRPGHDALHDVEMAWDAYVTACTNAGICPDPRCLRPGTPYCGAHEPEPDTLTACCEHCGERVWARQSPHPVWVHVIPNDYCPTQR